MNQGSRWWYKMLINDKSLCCFIPVRQRVKDKIARDREERAQKVTQSLVQLLVLLKFPFYPVPFIFLFITTSAGTNNNLHDCFFHFTWSSLEAVGRQARPHRPNLPSPAPRHPPATALHPLRRSMMSPGYRYSFSYTHTSTHWSTEHSLQINV